MPVSQPAPRRKTGTPLMTRRGRVVVLASSCLVSVALALVQFQPSKQPLSQQRPAISQERQLASVEPAPAPRPIAARPVQGKTSATPVASAPRRAPSARTFEAPVQTEKAELAPEVSAPILRDEVVVPVQTVTISGCLEQDAERFLLKDTGGEDAPRSRNWKSGFLRSSTSTIDVVDHADRLHLPTYVGQRISLTGTLVEREMQVRSVAIVAESCQERSV